MNDKKYWVAFSKNLKVGYGIISLLLKYFSSLEKAWKKGGVFQFKKAGIKNELLHKNDPIKKDYEYKKEVWYEIPGFLVVEVIKFNKLK